MYKALIFTLSLYAPFISANPTEIVQKYFYDIIFLNGLTLSGEAFSYCQKNSEHLSKSKLDLCQVFKDLNGKEMSTRVYKGFVQPTKKMKDSVFYEYSDEDYSRYQVNAYTHKGESFTALIDTASYVSFADIYPNMLQDRIYFKGPYNRENTVGLALIDVNTDIGGIGNKTILTKGGKVGVLGFDFIGQYDQFSFYSDGIAIQPEDITCTEKCVYYDADFDGENLHFFYPLNGRIERVSFETGSPISTVPFSLEDRCIDEEIDFSELEERGLDVGDEAKICKKDFEFGDYTMQSSVVTQTSRDIDGEPLAVMGMNMINAFDHVTVDMPAGKIYFYSPE
ncbi:hypothetical protein KDW99_01535 [Marinomonas rhizomae]|uniref:hypothetical protein n=1 Tax=Marinomonas rhizomae TaxID=491948 RepID=UPI00210335B8|nr:hypothetical protein [Marinomonas rhizomae]UTV99859.1 hypothetical protein KDW99_01535 [Marinomonas rhizomae]